MLLVSHGSDGDVLPFVRLGRTLRGRGHEVTLITHAPYASAALGAGLDFAPIDTAAEYERQLGDTAGLLAGQAPGRWLEFYERHGLFGQAQLEFRAIAERHAPGRTVLVGRHTSAVSVLMAAERLGAPAAWVAVSPVQIMAARGARHLYATVLREGLEEVRAAAGLSPDVDWAEYFHSADLELGLWPAWFDRAGARSPGRVRLTGFPLADDRPRPIPARAEELLAGPVPPVLVTGGTGRMLHPEFYPTAVAACARAGRPALLVVRHRDLVPEILPEGVRWFPALPFREVMPRVGVVLHHGGIGTLARALAARTPQVILAHGVDRPDNAERLAALGLARWLPQGAWTPDEIAPLLSVAPSQEPPIQAVPGDGAEAAAAEIETLLGRGRDPRAAPLPEPGAAEPLRERLRRLPPVQRRELLRRMEGRR
ncbi:glycosyltransferase [Actinomadura sp.]|uniref:glycosyltransferase n=1 Tax=Actinomadura sp. TaxID=1989 RepID=UPI0037CA7A93